MNFRLMGIEYLEHLSRYLIIEYAIILNPFMVQEGVGAMLTKGITRGDTCSTPMG